MYFCTICKELLPSFGNSLEANLKKYPFNSTSTGSKKDHTSPEGMLYKLFKYIYAPTLMKKWVRAAVVIIFFGWLCSSLAVVNKIEVKYADLKIRIKTFLKACKTEYK